MNIARGERYELCRSVHAEQNAIISASRDKMIGSDLYLVGKDHKTGEYVKGASPCMLCKRFVINAGIKRVIARENKAEYTIYDVNEWIKNDESLEGKLGY